MKNFVIKNAFVIQLVLGLLAFVCAMKLFFIALFMFYHVEPSMELFVACIVLFLANVFLEISIFHARRCVVFKTVSKDG